MNGPVTWCRTFPVAGADVAVTTLHARQWAAVLNLVAMTTATALVALPLFVHVALRVGESNQCPVRHQERRHLPQVARC